MPENTPKFSSITEALKILGYKIEEEDPKSVWIESKWAKKLRKEEESARKK